MKTAQLFSTLITILLILVFFPKITSGTWIIDFTNPVCDSITFIPTTATPGTIVVVTVEANDPGITPAGIRNIVLSRNGSQVSSGSASPLTYNWTTGSAGTYTFTVSLLDRAGNKGPCTASYTVSSPTDPTPTPIPTPTPRSWMKTSGGSVHINQ